MKKEFRIEYVGREWDGKRDPVAYLTAELQERNMTGVTTFPRDDEPYKKNVKILRNGFAIISDGARTLEIEAENEAGIENARKFVLGIVHKHRDQRDYLLTEKVQEGVEK